MWIATGFIDIGITVGIGVDIGCGAGIGIGIGTNPPTKQVNQPTNVNKKY